jgi:hypothetical protein
MPVTEDEEVIHRFWGAQMNAAWEDMIKLRITLLDLEREILQAYLRCRGSPTHSLYALDIFPYYHVFEEDAGDDSFVSDASTLAGSGSGCGDWEKFEGRPEL